MKDLFGTNWENELQPNEKAVFKEDGDEIPVVFLAGLQRLAREAGLIRQSVQILTPSDTMVQAVFSCTFERPGGLAAEFVGAADCTKQNTKGKYSNYPTAVAESRAEARCLRKALGIRTLSSEEVGLRENFGSLEASPGGKADSQLIAAIQKLCETRNIEIVRLLDSILEPARASSIFQLSELTTQEAQQAMAWLNNQKTVVSTKDKRDARKAELQEKLKE